MEQTKLKLVDVQSSISETPNEGGSKLEATSPLYSDIASLKKTRPDTMDELGEASTAHDLVEIQSGTVSDVHVFAQPMNPADIINVAKELRSIMSPELKSIIEGFQPYIKETVTDAVTEDTKHLNTELTPLTESNLYLSETNEDLAKKNVDLEKRLAEVESANDNLEQYSRRNSLRISGFAESPNESTDDMARELDIQLDNCDIDRSHRMGKIGQKDSSGQPKHREIFVKFATYNTRQRLYSKRKELHESDKFEKIIFNEDLTKTRSKLLFDARTLVRVNKLHSAYASDGKIFVKDNDDERYLIKCTSDLTQYGDPKA